MPCSKSLINGLTAAVFILCLLLGYQMSLRKVLWNDELYTQTTQIERYSYAQFAKGDFNEGCNNPLFYLIQKSIVTAAHYQFPFSWNGQEDGEIEEPYSQVLLRLSSNIFMSLGIALIVRYFLNISLGAGVLALITSLSSFMVLAYWAEARPYSLFFLLTVVQLLLFIRVCRSPRGDGWQALALIHILLALTIVVSIGQILIVSLILWCKGQRSLKRNIFLVIVPLLMCGYYFWIASTKVGLYAYQVPNFLELFFEGFAGDRLLLLVLLGAISVAGNLYYKKDVSDEFGKKLIRDGIFCLVLFISFGLLLLSYYKLHEIPVGPTLNSRYLIFLTPIEIMATVYGILGIFRFLKNNRAGWWIAQFVVLVCFFYIYRFLLLYKQMYSKAIFLA